MKPALSIMNILDRALQGKAPSREESIHLLGLREDSLETSYLRATADFISRQRFTNEGMLLGQIGLESFPCPAKCGFCAFGEGHTQFPETKMSPEEIIANARSLTSGGTLYALFLMLMHTFDFEELLGVIASVRQVTPSNTCLVVNIGDFDAAQARELKAAGVSGATMCGACARVKTPRLIPPHASHRFGRSRRRGWTGITAASRSDPNIRPKSWPTSCCWGGNMSAFSMRRCGG